MKKPSLINKNLILAAALISACEYSFAQTQTQTYNTSGTFTFTVPAGVSSIIVECWGAGGGGGGNSTTADGAGGGGGGAYSRSVLTVTPGNFSLTVGAGGAGGSGGNGTDGGDTWFGSSTTILAAGGKRGYAPSGGAAGVSGAGGLASASVGDVRYNGGNGGTGRDNNTGQGGPGGSSAGTGANGTSGPATWSTVTADPAPEGGGTGGNGGTAGNNGSPGSVPGGGGGGSGDKPNNGSSSRIGGSGASGQIIISWTPPVFYSQGSGDPNVLTNWRTASGLSPSDFASNNQTFIIRNGHNMTTTASGWNVSGTNTSVQIQNGGILTETTAITLSANTTFRIDDGGTLNHNVNSSTIFGGTESIGTGSTINYGLSGNQSVLPFTYGNLTISGSGTKTLSGNATVSGSLTLTAGTFAVAANSLTLNGPAIAGTPNNLSTTSSSTLIFGGSSTGIIVPSSVTALSNLTVSNPNGVTLSGPLSSATLTFTDGILNTGSTSLLTITNAAPGSIGGASAASYINGPVARALYAGQTNYGTPYIFPVGNGSEYHPLELLNATTGASSPIMLASVSNTGAASGDETTITDMSPRNWYLGTVSGSFTSALIRLTEAGLDVNNVIGRSSLQSGNYISAGGANIGSTITTSSAVSGSVLPSYFAIGKTVINTYYSYQSGDWNSTGTWTKDPSGSLWVGAGIPSSGDNVVILNGRTVSINQNGKNSLSLEIRMGGILDLKTFTGHNFGTVSGEGTLRLSSGTFPGGDYSEFVSSSGGTVEYYNLTGTGLSTSQLTYNNLIVSNYTASANTVFLNNSTNPVNYLLNGDFSLVNGSTGSLTFYFGNPTASDNLINMTVNGNFTVGGGCNIRVNNFASGHSIPNPNNNTTPYPVHTVVLYGDFTNNGSVRFTGLPSPVINSYYTLTTTAYGGTNYGDVQVYFRGATNNTVTLNGVTDFFRMIIEKGTNQTSILDITASGTGNFALFAPNNQGNNTFDGGPEGYGYGAYYKALFLRYGTLKLGTNISIPSLSEGGQDFNLIPTAALWVNGANVSTTVTGFNGTGYQAATLYGRLRISSGQFSTGDAAGIVLGTLGTPEIIIEGTGILDVSQAWSQTGGTNRVSYIQSGGTANFRLQGENHAGAMLGLANPNTVFTMSGGTLNFTNNTFIGGGTSYQIMDIQPQTGNYQVTGGTVNLNLPGSGTVYTINTTAPIHNLNISNRTGTNTTTIRWTTPASELTVLNDLTLGAGSALDLGTNTVGLTVGHNFTLPAGSTYTPGNNTTTFNGAGGQIFTNAGTITTGLNNFTVSNHSNTTITSALTIRGTLAINSSCFLNDQGNIISVSGNIVNAGTHTSQANGAIIINGTGAQNIGGSGSGIFGNLTLNKTSGSAVFTSNQSLTGNLRLVSGILNIANFNLSLSGNSNIYDVLTGNPAPTTFGNSKMIITSGQQSDGGLTKAFNATGSFLYPVGTGTVYHPATITITEDPGEWGNITVRPVPDYHPFAITGNEVLNYYWKVTSENFTGIQPGSVSHSFRYASADAGPSVNSYITGIYNPYGWTPGAAAQVDKINRNILFPSINIIDGEYTAGIPGAFGTVLVFYSHRSGNWDTPSTWSNVSNDPSSPDATSLPGINNPVVIGDGSSNNHVITITSNNKSVGGLQISSGSTLDIQATTGHDFGALPDLKITGTGTLRIASANFPSGDFGNFLGSDGGTVEYYTETAPSNIGSAFTLPTTYLAGTATKNITTYNNLKISPATGKNITFPNTDLLIFRDLNISVSGTSATGISGFNAQNNTRTVTINGNLNVNNGNLQYTNGNSRAQNVLVKGDVNIASGAVFDVAASLSATNTLSIEGSLVNNGIFDMYAGSNQICNVTFTGSENKQISGTTAVRTDFNILTVNKGTDRNSLLDVTVNAFELNPSLPAALVISSGTFRLSSPITITLTTSNPFTIPISGCLSANTGTINIGSANNNAADLILQGKLEVLNTGIVNVGNGSGSANDIEYAAAGNPEIYVTGGSLNVDGQIRRNTSNTLGSLWFNQAGGTILVKGNSYNTSRGMFEVVNSGSRFMISGGTLIIQRAGSISYADVVITPETSLADASNGGHTLITGNASTPASQIFNLNISSPLWNLTVDGTTQNKTANLVINQLTILNNLTINSNGDPGSGSVFRANDLDVTIGGNLTNNNLSTDAGVDHGGYQSGAPGSTQKTIFTGTGWISGTGTNLTNFADLVLESSGSTPYIRLGASSNILVNNNLLVQSGTLSDEGNTITVLGDIYNLGIHTSPSAPGGGIILANGIKQTISGDGNGQFGNITVNNPAGAELDDNIKITGRLNLSLGSLYVNNYRLTMDVNSSFTGTFDSKHMVSTNGVLSDGGIVKLFPGSASGFIFPVGSNGKYHPVTFSFTTSDAGSIKVIPVGQAHPANNPPVNDQLNYYWRVETTGFSGLTSSTQVYNYLESDVTGNESNYHGSLYQNYTWMDFGTSVINTVENTITITSPDLPEGEYTAGEPPNYSLKHKLYSLKSGNWNDGTVWAEDSPSNPPCGYYPNGNPVFIQQGHVITMTTNNAYAYNVNLEGILDIGTTSFHSLGYLTDSLGAGTGKLMLESSSYGMYIFPGGDPENFLESQGTTIEYYGNTDASLPLQIGNIYRPYQNLVLSGSGTKYMNTEDMKIQGSLTINNGSHLNNTYYSKNIFIHGNWTDLNASSVAFTPGSGSVSFEGTTPQILNISSSLTEIFFDLRINNASGLSITGNGRIQVSRNLILSSGIITTNSVNSLTITNPATNAVSGGSSSSFINGPLRKQISNGSYFMFPVGKEGTTPRYGNVLVSEVVNAGIWEAEYYNELPPYNIISLKQPISHVSNNEYWRINGVAGGSGNVRIRWDALSGYAGSPASTRSKIRIVEWNPAGTPGPQWEYRGKVLNDGGDESGTVSTDAAISLSPGTDLHYFTIGDEGLPTATITSSLTAAICNDAASSSTIMVALTGTPPWSLTYRLGNAETTLNNIATSPLSIILNSASAGITQPITVPTVFNFNITNVNDLVGTPGITDYVTTVALTVNPVPDNTINGRTLVGTGEVVTYSTPADASTYLWTLSSNGTPLTGNTSVFTVTWGSGSPGPYTITLVKTAANGCQVTNSIQVTTSTTPTPVISGNQYVCAGSAGNVYSTPNVTGHDYTWSIIPSGAGTIVSGAGTSSITVNWNGPATGTTVNVREHITASGTPGIFTDASLPVEIGIQPSASTPSWSAPATVCNGSTAAVTINNSENGVRYQIRLSSNNSNSGSAVNGNGGTITLYSSAITSTTTFYIYAYTLAPFNCSTVLANPSSTFTVTALQAINYGTLSAGDQTICSTTLPNIITFSTMPSGGAGSFSYQWYSYNGIPAGCPSGSSIPAGWTPVALANSDNYTPPALSSSMSYAVMVTPEGSPLCGTATWAGGCRQITVTPAPSASISYSGSPWCTSESVRNVTLTGTPGGVFSAPAGLSLDGSSGAITPAASTGGTYTVTYTIAAAGGCSEFTATATVTIYEGMVWTGDISTEWDLPANWSCGFVPDPATGVQIPNVPNKPVLGSGITGSVNNLTIEAGSSLVLAGGTLQISGTITNNGTFDASEGTIEINGSSAQIIGAGAFTGNTVQNLTVSNVSGVTLLGPLNATGIVLVESGDLSSGGFLTLVSSSSGTALIDGSGNGTVSGNVTMQRYLPSGFGYKYFSSPFQNATVGEFDDDRIIDPYYPTVYRYDENNIVSGMPASGWVEYEASANSLSPLSGYAVNFGDLPAARTVDVTGIVNNGNLSATFYNHNQTYTQGFNLAGNPYPSPIDWTAPSGWTKTNIDNALYFFKASSSDPYGGRYSTWVNGISSDDTVSNIIPSMQGFFIHVSNGPPWPITATLALDNNARVTGPSQIFAKSGEKKPESLLRLTATLDDNPASADQMVIYFDQKAESGFDGSLDALKLINTDYYSPSLYSFSADAKKLSINALPERNDTISCIPLGVSASIDGYLKIKLTDAGSMLAGWKIYLSDMKAGVEYDLREGDGYRVFLEAGECNDRFVLNLTPVATVIPETKPDDVFSLYSSHGIVKSYIDLEKTGEGDLKIFNLAGQLLFVERITETGYNEFHPGLRNGIYIATFTSGKYRSSKKLYISNR